MMKTEPLLILIALVLSGTGCRLAHEAWHTTIAEPIHYPRNIDDKLSHRRFTSMAEIALEEAVVAARADLDDYQCDPFSDDFERGFIDGFVQYMTAGGTGAPPALPPRRYWKGKFQNPSGYQQIQDWFAGYEHGAEIARASNYRTFVTVPVSDAIVSDTMQSIYGRISTSEPTDETDEGKVGGEDRFVDKPDPPQRVDAPSNMSRLQGPGQVK
jgi:hypothetical protein